MKKLFQNPVVAWTVLILAVVLACVLGQLRKAGFESRKTTELLDVKYHEWINDSANMLSSDTKNTIEYYNTKWDKEHHAVIAVATVPDLRGWGNGKNDGGEEYGTELGVKWGLGPKDMLLLYVKDEYWYLVYSDEVGHYVNRNNWGDTFETTLSGPYYKGQFDRATEEFFQKADIFYDQSIKAGLGEGMTDPQSQPEQQSGGQSSKGSGGHVFKVILLIIGIFVVWAILDRIRYNRYRRRAAVNVAPTVSYYPIFWGRPARAAAPPPPVSPARPAAPPSGVYHRPSGPSRPSGSYTPPQRPTTSRPASRPSGSYSRPGTTPRQTTPSRPGGTRPGNTARPGNNTRPSGFGGGGLGGGKR
ncbi:MAG: TPM domain-containing protein [Oscillospiraceae bacterium]|nr:TPM domain-containing protein [Oscillospiraceae bacterium]